MKTGQLFELDATLEMVGSQQGLRGFTFPHAVRVVRKALEFYMTPAMETRKKILDEYGQKQPNGEFVVERQGGSLIVPWQEGRGEEANKAMQELFETPVQLIGVLPKIKTKWFDEAGVVGLTEAMVKVLDPVLDNSE